MTQRYSNTKKKVQDSGDTSPVESLKNFGNSAIKKSVNDIKDIGSGMFDQVFGGYSSYEDDFGDFEYGYRRETKKPPKRRQEFKVFNYQEYYENQRIKEEIKQLTELIKKEIELLKKADKALLTEVKDIQKLTVDALPSKPGIYHIRFLEIVLSILRTIRAKVGESRTWLDAMKTKKKKRGSLFVVRSKTKGTQYSLSSELNTARSVQ